MKTRFQILLFLFISTSLLSQQEDFGPKNDIGLNVNSILNQLIFKQQAEDILEPRPEFSTLFTYRHFIHSKQAIRLSLGYIQESKDDTIPSIFGGSALIDENRLKYFSLRFGMIERYFLRKNKVRAYIGLEWIFRHMNQRSNKFESFFGGIFVEEIRVDRITKKTILGLGVPLGVQYIISDRLMLSTEFSLEAINTFSKTKSQTEGHEGAVFDKNPEVQSLDFRPPLALFVHYRF